MPRRRFDWMGMHDGVAHAIEPGALAPRTGGTAEESVAQGWPNGLRFTRAAVIDRDGSRAKVSFQNNHDLARREAASGASAGWAALNEARS